MRSRSELTCVIRPPWFCWPRRPRKEQLVISTYIYTFLFSFFGSDFCYRPSVTGPLLSLRGHYVRGGRHSRAINIEKKPPEDWLLKGHAPESALFTPNLKSADTKYKRRRFKTTGGSSYSGDRAPPPSAPRFDWKPLK